MIIDEVSIPSKCNTKFLLRLFHNTSQTEDTYINHSHSELEIILFRSGKGVYLVNKTKEYIFQAGDVFLFRSNEDHIVSKRLSDENFDSLCIHFLPQLIWSPRNEMFDTKFLKAFLNKEGEFNHMLNRNDLRTQIISSIIHQIEQEFALKKPEFELMIKTKLLTMLVEINRYFGTEMQTDKVRQISDKNLRLIEKSIQYMTDHIDSCITLDQLSKIATMSRSYYSHLFKELNGISPWDYLTYKRIETAEKYLIDSEDPIIEIANKCGFNNSANFNRSFKNITGRTPSQFRQASHENSHAIPELF